jgi:hypothetical protein
LKAVESRARRAMVRDLFGVRNGRARRTKLLRGSLSLGAERPGPLPGTALSDRFEEGCFRGSEANAVVNFQGVVKQRIREFEAVSFGVRSQPPRLLSDPSFPLSKQRVWPVSPKRANLLTPNA